MVHSMHTYTSCDAIANIASAGTFIGDGNVTTPFGGVCFTGVMNNTAELLSSYGGSAVNEVDRLNLSAAAAAARMAGLSVMTFN